MGNWQRIKINPLLGVCWSYICKQKPFKAGLSDGDAVSQRLITPPLIVLKVEFLCAYIIGEAPGGKLRPVCCKTATFTSRSKPD